MDPCSFKPKCYSVVQTIKALQQSLGASLKSSLQICTSKH